jgi:acyl carrier protein
MDKDNEQRSYDSVLEHVVTAAAAVFGQPVRPSDNFFDLGGDSVAAVELVVTLSATLGFEPDADTLIFASDLADFALALTR